MSTSSAIPDDLIKYASTCTELDQQLQSFAQQTLANALDAYRLQCSSFSLTSSGGLGPNFGPDGYAHGYGSPFALQNDLAQFCAQAADIDTWVGNVGAAFLQAHGYNVDPSTPAGIATLERAGSQSLPADDGKLALILNPQTDGPWSEEDVQAYLRGAALAKKVNDNANWFGTNFDISGLDDSTRQELANYSGNPYFDLGFINALDADQRNILINGCTYGATVASDPEPEFTKALVAAYSLGGVSPDVTAGVYAGWDKSGGGALCSELDKNPVAALNFIQALSADEISHLKEYDDFGNFHAIVQIAGKQETFNAIAAWHLPPPGSDIDPWVNDVDSKMQQYGVDLANNGDGDYVLWMQAHEDVQVGADSFVANNGVAGVLTAIGFAVPTGGASLLYGAASIAVSDAAAAFVQSKLPNDIHSQKVAFAQNEIAALNTALTAHLVAEGVIVSEGPPPQPVPAGSSGDVLADVLKNPQKYHVIGEPTNLKNMLWQADGPYWETMFPPGATT